MGSYLLPCCRQSDLQRDSQGRRRPFEIMFFRVCTTVLYVMQTKRRRLQAKPLYCFRFVSFIIVIFLVLLDATGAEDSSFA